MHHFWLGVHHFCNDEILLAIALKWWDGMCLGLGHASCNTLLQSASKTVDYEIRNKTNRQNPLTILKIES